MHPINKFGRILFFVCVALVVVVGGYQLEADTILFPDWLWAIIGLTGLVAILIWQKDKK